jgi:hypothetical protein
MSLFNLTINGDKAKANKLFIDACRERKFDLVYRFLDTAFINADTLLESLQYFDEEYICCYWNPTAQKGRCTLFCKGCDNCPTYQGAWMSGNLTLCDDNSDCRNSIIEEIGYALLEACKQGDYELAARINRLCITHYDTAIEALEIVCKTQSISKEEACMEIDLKLEYDYDY